MTKLMVVEYTGCNVKNVSMGLPISLSNVDLLCVFF